MTDEEIITTFRLTVPEMDNVTDEELKSDIAAYKDYVSERRFGKLYGKAVSYFIAHMRTLHGMLANAIADGGNAGDPFFTAGSLVGEKEGDLQRNYANGGSSTGSGDSGTSEALLQKTLYGQMFLQLRAMCIVTATVGGVRCGPLRYR